MRRLRSHRWLLVVGLAALTAGCRFRPRAPYWIEALGDAQGLRVGAWPGGALAIGTDRHLSGYPGGWSRPWLPQGPPQDLRSIAGARAVVFGLLADGQVARWSGASWTPEPGSLGWGASEVGAADDDRLLVVVGGHLRRVDGGALLESPCSSVNDVRSVGGADGEIYVLDGGGSVHVEAGGTCRSVDAPAALQRLAVAPGRVLGVASDGGVWRRRDGAWTALPSPVKYRPGRMAFKTRARDVAVSAHSTWLMDEEGAIFLLSDES